MTSNLFCKIACFILFSGTCIASYCQAKQFKNNVLLKKLYADSSYKNLRIRFIKDYQKDSAGKWGQFIAGIDEKIITEEKVIALTFDACGSRNGNGYDSALINFLKKEKIPATLFISGQWIDANYNNFVNLAKDTLFEIENHGLRHKPCSIKGEEAYGIEGTKDIGDVFDEIEANARKIQMITGLRPCFYRSATAFSDEACTRIARRLGFSIVNYNVLSCDAIPNASVQTIQLNVLNNLQKGSIVLMHMNHPEWNTCKALKIIVPALRKQGYTFGKLEQFRLKGRK